VPRLSVHSFSISIHRYGAGLHQVRKHPPGVGGAALHEWLVGTRTFRRMHAQHGGTTGPDDDFAARGLADVGARVTGRNMFGPARGPWADDSWRGGWRESRLGGVATIRQYLEAGLVDDR
jgi:hypothetical protein